MALFVSFLISRIYWNIEAARWRRITAAGDEAFFSTRSTALHQPSALTLRGGSA
jgi:hypothetical protein